MRREVHAQLAQAGAQVAGGDDTVAVAVKCPEGCGQFRVVAPQNILEVARDTLQQGRGVAAELPNKLLVLDETTVVRVHRIDH